MSALIGGRVKGTLARRLIAALAVVLLAGVTAARPGLGDAPIAAAQGAGTARPLVAAHRGGSLLWPENSLLAFRNALALGVDYLETDVHLTADGEVVVIHDPTLERTTTRSGAVRDLALTDVTAARLRGLDGAPTAETVPTLAALLDLSRAAWAELLLEIKVDANRQRYAGIEEKVLDLVRARGLASRTIVMAFHRETIRRIRELDPSIRTTLLAGRGEVQRDRVRPAEFVKQSVEVGAAVLGIDHRLIDADVVSAARKSGVRVAAWTVNEEPDIRRAIDLGADVLITDRPDLALRLVGR